MFTLTCPACRAEVTLPARRLLVRVDAGHTTSGEVLFTCLSCHESVALTLDASALAALVMAGVTHLSLSVPAVEHPEPRPDGPALTADDVLDLHARLAGEDWFDELVRPAHDPARDPCL